MAIKNKRAAAREGLPRLTTLSAAAAIVGATAFLAPPVFADQPTSFAASVPISSAISASAVVVGQTSSSMDEPSYQTIGSGKASYYGRELAGNRTASGERFDPSDLTAAHRTLPLGSKVRVTNPRTGDSVIVRINDRGPFHSNRLIDLSEAAARQVGIRAAGSGIVELSVAAD
jgi:rare lipoprotein A